jgi:NTE family protein
MSHVVVLSSGFLAFARHMGVIAALEDRGVVPTAIVGVSSGAVVGALWASGLNVAEMRAFLGDAPPYKSLRARWPWASPGPGLVSLDGLAARLREVLPARFDTLPRPFGAGVVRRTDGACRLIHEGDLVEAVTASCAIPYLFGPRTVNGEPCVDGGAKDRIFLDAALEVYPAECSYVHVVGASAVGRQRRSGVVDQQLERAATRTRLVVIRTPRSEASFASLGDVDAQIEATRRMTLQALDAA